MKRNTSKVLALCILSALCTLPVMGQLKNTTPASQKYQPKPVEPVAALETDINKVKPDFIRAVYNGNLEGVKKILRNNFLHAPALLRTKMSTTHKYKEETVVAYPVCIAAAKGYNSLIKYMVKFAPSLLKEKCENSWGNLWDAAIENQKIDTAILLLDLGVNPSENQRNVPPFAKVALFVQNATQLQKIIPVLLDKKINPNNLFNAHSNWIGDGFFNAASENNIHFITTLRDEMKKRGQQPVAELRTLRCPGHDDFNELRASEQILENSSQAKLLRKYGVKVNVRAKSDLYGCE